MSGTTIARTFFVAVFAVAALARADSQRSVRLFSASPDEPRFAFAWRGQLRGSMGTTLAFAGGPDDDGFVLLLPAMIELHNHRPDLIPNNLWRGLLGVEAAWRSTVRIAGRDARLATALALHHESDHTTSDLRDGPVAGSVVWARGFLVLNSLGLQSDLTIPVGDHRLTLRGAARLHLVTCTTSDVDCASLVEHGEQRSSRTFQGDFEAIFDAGFEAPVPGRWRGFASLAATWLAPAVYVREERRLSLAAGASFATSDRGAFALAATLLVGNEVGFERRYSGVLPGLVLRWLP